MHPALRLLVAPLKGVGVLRFTDALPPSVTYSRTGAATAFTVAGVVVPFAANAPPLTDRGLLLETAATNYAIQSQSFSGWSGDSAAVVPNATTAPDGTATAAKLPGVALSAYQSRYVQPTFAVGGAVATRSVFAKAAEYNWLYLQQYDGVNNKGAYFNLATGAIGVTDAGITASIIPAANGFYRPSVTFTAAGGATSERVQIALAQSNGGSPTFVGDGTSGEYIWGAQLNLGGPTSYIPTTAAAATRGLPTATTIVPPGRTVARATYGLSNTVVDVTGLTPGSTFDLVTGRAWLGLGNELKTLEWRP